MFKVLDVYIDKSMPDVTVDRNDIVLNVSVSQAMEGSDFKFEDFTQEQLNSLRAGVLLAQYYEQRYAKNSSALSPPSINQSDANPSGWSVIMPSLAYYEYLWVTIARKASDGTLIQNWSTPVRMTGVDGNDGANGANGSNGRTGDKGEPGSSPALVFRGEYDPFQIYYGMPSRVDAVKYMNSYYSTTPTSGSISGISPVDTSKWIPFGESFQSVATDLLLAQYANIAGFIFKDNSLISQLGTVNGSPSSDYQDASFQPNISLDGVTGVSKIINGIFVNGNFSGRVVANAGSIGSFNIEDGRLIGLNEDGSRIEIHPNENEIRMYDKYNQEILSIYTTKTTFENITVTKSYIKTTSYLNRKKFGSIIFGDDRISFFYHDGDLITKSGTEIHKGGASFGVGGSTQFFITNTIIDGETVPYMRYIGKVPTISDVETGGIYRDSNGFLKIK